MRTRSAVSGVKQTLNFAEQFAKNTDLYRKYLRSYNAFFLLTVLCCHPVKTATQNNSILKICKIVLVEVYTSYSTIFYHKSHLKSFRRSPMIKINITVLLWVCHKLI